MADSLDHPSLSGCPSFRRNDNDLITLQIKGAYGNRVLPPLLGISVNIPVHPGLRAR